MILIQIGNEQLMFVSEKIGMEQFEKLNWNLWQVLWSLLRLKKEKRVIEHTNFILRSFLKELPVGLRIFVYFFICLRRVTFVRSYKSNQKSFLKNFSVILSVCWFTKDNGESLHPILLDSFGIFISVISMQSDREKFLADAFFCPPSLEGGGPLAVKDFFLYFMPSATHFCLPATKVGNPAEAGWLSVKMPVGSLAPGVLRDEAEPNYWDGFSAIWPWKIFGWRLFIFY